MLPLLSGRKETGQNVDVSLPTALAASAVVNESLQNHKASSLAEPLRKAAYDPFTNNTYKSRTKLWPGQYAWIGVELPVVNSAKFYSMDVGLAWNYEDGETSTNFYSSFYTKQLAFLDELDSRVRRRSDAQFEIDKAHYGLILWEESGVGTEGQYQLDHLEKLVLEWISVWKRAGGVAKIFSNGRNKK